MKKKPDLYAEKRKILKEKRKLMNRVLGTDEVDGKTFQRNYGDLVKTRRAIKVEIFGSKSKSSKYGDDTSIEKFIEELLIENNIKFVKQKQIKTLNVDYSIVDKKIALQINGCYWHVCPVCYIDGAKNNIQRKNIEKDKVAHEIIKQAGYELLEIWEHEIKNDPLNVKEKILNLK